MRRQWTDIPEASRFGIEGLVPTPLLPSIVFRAVLPYVLLGALLYGLYAVFAGFHDKLSVWLRGAIAAILCISAWWLWRTDPQKVSLKTARGAILTTALTWLFTFMLVGRIGYGTAHPDPTKDVFAWWLMPIWLRAAIATLLYLLGGLGLLVSWAAVQDTTATGKSLLPRYMVQRLGRAKPEEDPPSPVLDAQLHVSELVAFALWVLIGTLYVRFWTVF